MYVEQFGNVNTVISKLLFWKLTVSLKTKACPPLSLTVVISVQET